MRLVLPTVLLLTLILSSCQKSKEQQCIENRPDQLIAGNVEFSSCAVHKSWKLFLERDFWPYDNLVQSIDVDNDGKDDFRLWAKIFMVPSSTSYSIAMESINDDFYFAVVEQHYHQCDLINYAQPDNPNSSYAYVSCKPNCSDFTTDEFTAGRDTIPSDRSVLNVQGVAEHELIQKDLTWQQEASSFFNSLPCSPGTDWRYNQDAYIPIMELTKNGEEILGWIKFRSTINENVILETYISSR